jgi:hypothetical protein
MERCPVCRARMGDEPQCRRCGSDFSSALTVEKEMRALLGEALLLWRQGHTGTALRLVGRALTLKAEPTGLALRDLLIDRQLRQATRLLSQGESAEALRLCQQILAIHPAPLALALRGFIENYDSRI